MEIAAALMLSDRAVAETRPAKRDPIFQVIARHWLAEQKLERALNGEVPSAVKFAKKSVDDATKTLLRTAPTTEGGTATLLWYVHQNQQAGNSLATDAFLDAVEAAALAALRATGEG